MKHSVLGTVWYSATRGAEGSSPEDVFNVPVVASLSVILPKRYLEEDSCLLSFIKSFRGKKCFSPGRLSNSLGIQFLYFFFGFMYIARYFL